MATLPDDQQLGPAPRLQADRPLAVVDTSGLTNGVKNLGAGLSQLGAGLDAYGRAQQAKQDELQKARASADYLIGRQTLDDERDNADTADDLKDHPAKYQQNLDAAASGITDPRQRELFIQQHRADVNAAGIATSDKVFDLNRDAEMGADYQRLQDLRNGALKNPALFDANKNVGLAIIDKQNENGYITDVEAAKQRQAWQQNLAVGAVGMLPPAQRLAALSAVDSNPKAKAAYEFFVQKGWTPAQAAGLVGHLFIESHFNTGAFNPADGADGSDSIGIGQWNSNRAAALKSFAAARGKPVSDFQTQLEFVQHELDTSESAAAEALKKAQTPSEAASAALGYERPRGWQQGLAGASNGANRLAAAQKAYSSFSGDKSAPQFPAASMVSYIPPDKAQDMELQAQDEWRRQEAGTAQQIALQTKDISDAQSLVTDGFDVSPAKWDAMRQQYGASANPKIKDAYDTLDQIRSTISQLKGQPPEQAQATVDRMTAALAASSNPTPRDHAVLQAAQRYAKTLLSDVDKDPLGRAQKDGIIPSVVPLDGSSPDAFIQSIQQRAVQAQTAAKAYGRPVKYLQPTDKVLLARMAAQGGTPMVQAAGAIVNALGPQAGAFFREIGGDAPKFAMMGRSMAMGASPQFIADLAEHQRLVSDPSTSKGVELPNLNPSDNYSGAVIGTALANVPGMGAAVREAARNVYAVRALREGLPKDISTAQAQLTFQRGVQEAAGATFDGDTRYGGVSNYKAPGWWAQHGQVLLPPTVKSDKLPEVVKAITDADLAAMPAQPVGENGKPITTRQIQSAYLTARGRPGLYWLSMNDPSSKDPQWIQGSDGNPFTLDLNALEPKLRDRVPDAYRGR